jgi:hypothetical protein
MSWEIKEIMEIQHQSAVLEETLGVDHTSLQSLNSSAAPATPVATASSVEIKA